MGSFIRENKMVINRIEIEHILIRKNANLEEYDLKISKQIKEKIILDQ